MSTYPSPTTAIQYKWIIRTNNNNTTTFIILITILRAWNRWGWWLSSSSSSSSNGRSVRVSSIGSATRWMRMIHIIPMRVGWHCHVIHPFLLQYLLLLLIELLMMLMMTYCRMVRTSYRNGIITVVVVTAVVVSVHCLYSCYPGKCGCDVPSPPASSFVYDKCVALRLSQCCVAL